MKDYEKLLGIDPSDDNKEIIQLVFQSIDKIHEPLSSILKVIEPRFIENNDNIKLSDLRNLLDFRKYLIKGINREITIDGFLKGLNVARLNNELIGKQLSAMYKADLFYHLIIFCSMYYNFFEEYRNIDQIIRTVKIQLKNTKRAKKDLSYMNGIQDALNSGSYYLTQRMKYLRLIKNNRGKPIFIYVAVNYAIENISTEFKFSHQYIYELLFSSIVYFQLDELKDHELNDSQTIKKWMQRYNKSNKIKELSELHLHYSDSEIKVHFIDDEYL